ncbi:RHS repeat domain-containing protein [Candidatus Accumulibacter aalborgensis]|nr:RHS repeat domain-containing protein [Candidatus Accumulibacter aalborgensis]
MSTLLWAATTARAGTERFDYDALGRLVRHLDSSGTVTEYAYDGVGNILEVRGSSNAGPPTVGSVVPTAVRRGQSVRLEVNGNWLSGARVTTSDPELNISNALTSAVTGASFTLTASAAAALGARVFTLSTSRGSAIFSLMIDPQMPTVSFAPFPDALAAGQSQQVTIILSNPDQVAHTLTLAIANPAVASVSPASVTFPPGQTQASVSVSAIASGTTLLNARSATLAPAELAIYVSAPVAGASSAYAPMVGVLRPEAPGGGASSIGPFTAPNVGLFRPEAPGGVGSLIGPIVAPDVGVNRE